MASTSCEAPPPSPAETPTVNNSTKTKSNSSKRSFVANFKAKFCVSKPKPLENNHHKAAASSSTATTNKNDDHGRALSLSSKMIRNDLLAADSAFAEAKKYMDHMNVKINQAHEKFEELQKLGGSQRDFDELRKDVMKLKFQIPSHGKIRSADSNPRRNRWPNINEAEDGMSHFFYKEPEDTHTGDFDGLLEAFHDLSLPWQRCLLCFFKFPPAAIIKRTTMIYLWIGLGLGYTWLSASNYVKMIFDKDDYGNTILNEFVEKGFIQPIYQNCSLAPDSCRMSISVRSALYEAAKASGFTSKDNLDLDLQNDNLGLDLENDRGHILGHACLINVGEAVINWESEIFDNTENIRCLCLGRWQSSATHHIELADAKILHGLKDLKNLTFLSLRGISMITELPASILELKNLAILDLQACHNLEVIPEDIGLLDNLTHLDMSECYFLEHMPKSLLQLSNLKVLKGFLIGDFNNNKQSCTLHDLSGLRKLRKLNIYVSVKDFCRLWDFDDLDNFKGLQKLTILWGGCSSQSQKAARMELRRRGHVILPSRLKKLDLQCFPTERLTDCSVTWRYCV
ncbi:disease resistance RPP13-like protein 4 [Rhododendron vialii]|uniref:disease resistance RPP13-like protein 4 n=1 Tax=Rhododendron vialii TaxID=182163 RepID=UPI00265FEA26|nr:disease resistance RPP13-like protein 4 [Rhododendron vialii]